jgi:hypothetical protein
MACYIVAFEPVGLAATTIRQRLQTLDSYCPIHSYCWAVLTTMNAVQLRDFLSEGIPTSKIFVVRSGTEAAWINAYGEKNNEWLKKNL